MHRASSFRSTWSPRSPMRSWRIGSPARSRMPARLASAGANGASAAGKLEAGTREGARSRKDGSAQGSARPTNAKQRDQPAEARPPGTGRTRSRSPMRPPSSNRSRRRRRRDPHLPARRHSARAEAAPIADRAGAGAGRVRPQAAARPASASDFPPAADRAAQRAARRAIRTTSRN